GGHRRLAGSLAAGANLEERAVALPAGEPRARARHRGAGRRRRRVRPAAGGVPAGRADGGAGPGDAPGRRRRPRLGSRHRPGAARRQGHGVRGESIPLGEVRRRGRGPRQPRRAARLRGLAGRRRGSERPPPPRPRRGGFLGRLARRRFGGADDRLLV
ncbi:MAG: hypothetical protein AVDCRST_MAG08-85, partial [uncultured Acetobacteraceae bacterium]